MVCDEPVLSGESNMMHVRRKHNYDVNGYCFDCNGFCKKVIKKLKRGEITIDFGKGRVYKNGL